MEKGRKNAAFKKTVWGIYRAYGRDLPWRKTHDPYRIMVSEIMLQQTQVDRVVPYYTRFVRAYPTVKKLAQAPLRDVLVLWQGLGYNRRGKYLHDAARAIVEKHSGVFPKDLGELRALPGIGPYTASAVAAFAYNIPSVCIETNIRTVYTHHFFPHQEKVADAAILALVEETLDHKNVREWYYALMDYGAYLKKNRVRINHKSTHYTKQSTFKGSNRELRGKILKLALGQKKRLSEKEIARHLGTPRERVSRVYHALVREKLI